ncbi:YadA-like family protein [Megasphaera sp. UPII 135-E]|uniref:YadA-like family protein n=1 Tax=Megasphaera sp. UPII 135-E TaxID=1000569 RepID=UPI00021A321D|nr:YadA-like family protein [Megasphaera sp. UPII 135-E]EGS35555.1 KID repeat protein [Megasphaera sp. UPII 135-E]
MKMRKKAILVSALLASLVSSGVMADQASDIQEAKDNAAKALGQVTALDGKVQHMENDLTKYKDKTDKLEKDLQDYDTVKTNAANAVQNKTDIIDLKQKVSTAEQKVADAEKNLNTQAEAFRQVGQGVDKNAKEAKQKAEEALNKANDVDGKVTALDGKVKNIEKDLTTYKDKTDKLEKDLQDYDTVKTNAENAVQNKADIIDLKQKVNKVGDLETKVTQIDNTVKRHNEEITQIKDGNKDFQEGIAEQLRQAKKETDTRVDGIDEKVKTVSDKADALDHKIDNTKTDLAATIRTVDEKVTKLGNPEARIKEVEKTFGDKLASMEGHTNKGLAKVTALSGLHPLGYDAASKWNISVATGHYKSENAIAMGAFFQPNRHVLLSFAGTVSGGDDAYTVGASIRVGRSGHKEMSGAAEGMISATEFYDIVGKLQDEIARQRQEIEALKNR